MGLHLKEGGDELGEVHEINVTPFIDVMLVLLIIFMVAAPLATVDIKMDLPASSATPQPRPDTPLFLSVKPGLELYIGNDEVKIEALGSALDKQTDSDKETTVFFQADKDVEYADVMKVMDALREAGYLKVGLVGLEAGAAK